MKEQERKKVLLEATSRIREEYIEEASEPVCTRPRWVELVATAAVLAVIIGALLFVMPTDQKNEVGPFLGIRAHAADGGMVILENMGDSVFLKDQISELFPGKNVYILDVSLENYTGTAQELTNGQFMVFHKGKYLKPGEADEYMAIQWLSREEDGMFGYRIIGWCETSDYITIQAHGAENKILHQKELRISNKNGYQMQIAISYTHLDDRSTDELIDVVMRQDYSSHLMFSSDLSRHTLMRHTGFQELSERPDAASKLLQLFIRVQNGEKIFVVDGYTDFLGRELNNDFLLSIVLSWDVFWDQLTPAEQALALEYDCWRKHMH